MDSDKEPAVLGIGHNLASLVRVLVERLPADIERHRIRHQLALIEREYYDAALDLIAKPAVSITYER